jgi:hypothetical protein
MLGLLVSIQCSLDSAGDHSSHTPKQQYFEAPFLLFAGKSDIALQHTYVEPGGFMLEDTFLLVEAKKDLSQGALVQTNLIAVPCVNVCNMGCCSVPLFIPGPFTLHDWHVACACLGESQHLTCRALVINVCPSALL